MSGKSINTNNTEGRNGREREKNAVQKMNGQVKVSPGPIELPIQIDKTHTEPYMPPPPRRLPRESVPKQLTLRQVHEHRGAPTKTGQDLTHKASHHTANQTMAELPLHERHQCCSASLRSPNPSVFTRIILRGTFARTVFLPVPAWFWH